jgi:hypothetical protein
VDDVAWAWGIHKIDRQFTKSRRSGRREWERKMVRKERQNRSMRREDSQAPEVTFQYAGAEASQAAEDLQAADEQAQTEDEDPGQD